MAFKATRNMPFSLILQKLVVVLGYLWNLQCCAISLLLFWKCFLLICLQLWTLPTFFKIKKRLENKKNAKKVKKRYQNKKTQKNVFFTSMSTSTATCRCARTSNSPRHSASPRYTSDPSLCAVGHTSDARACTGALPAGLWERRAGRPSGLPDASTPVGPERGGSGSSPRTRDHITDAAISLHWLRVPGRSQYKLAVLTYEILHVHGDAPRYLGPLSRVDDLPGRRTLRSTNANRLVVPAVKLNSRQPSLCGCGFTHLEYTANWRRCGMLAAHLPSTVKTFFYSSSHVLTSSSDIIQLVVLAVVAAL